MTNLRIFKIDGSAQTVSRYRPEASDQLVRLGISSLTDLSAQLIIRNIFLGESDRKTVRSEFIFNPSGMHFPSSLTNPNGRFRGGLQDDILPKQGISKKSHYHGPPEAGSYPGALLGAAGES